MLLRFGVSNHLSIRDFQELSFSASSLKDPDAGLIACAATPVGSVVPAAVIYGANASGKSNFVDALEAMRAMVLHSQIRWRPEDGVPRNAFALDPACTDAPSRFEIDLVLDGERYHYGFEATDRAFESEWLYVFPKSYRRVLFERGNGDFHFGRWLKGRNNIIRDLAKENSLYLSAAAQNGHEQFSKVYRYFRSIHGDRNMATSGFAASERSKLSGNDPDHRALEFLKKMDGGISGWQRRGIEFSEEEKTLKKNMSGTIFELAHKGRNGNPIHFLPDRESAGTRRLSILLGPIFRALDDGAPIIIDELDASLHTRASEAVLRLFSSPEANPKGAQIVATTHDTNLMNSPILRRDQIWFAEKDDGGATRIYPLTDIRTRKGDNIERGYLQDRYGATPRNLYVMSLARPR